MPGDDVGKDGRRNDASHIYARVALASFVAAIALAGGVFSRVVWAEFRWIAPVAAAALNVFLVAVAVRPDAEPRFRHDATPRPTMRGRFLHVAGWREIAAYLLTRLRAIRWWPWCVLAGSAVSLVLCAATWFVFDRRPPAGGAMASRAMAIACGIALALAFATLIAERLFAERAERIGAHHANSVLAAALRMALVVLLGGAACAALYAWAAADARWLACAIALLPAAMCCEYALRSVLAWFSPPGLPGARLQLVDSTLAQLLMRPPASPAELGASLRRRYGIDLRQSWVVHSTLRMLPAACVSLAVVAWLLSGVTMVQPDQRAVLERFGAPVAVWQPGLHVGLPWPFGRARLIDNGAVHQIVVSDVSGNARYDAAPLIAADARTPQQFDRLWDVAHPWETSQVIAGGNGRQQNFETVNADVRLDYRIGVSDAAARASLYRSSDVNATVRAIASREVVRYLASHTLDALIEARQTVIAEQLRRAVQRQLDALGSGIEVVAIVIESVHPPAGASAAWHGVQAAQIRAAASVAQARGLAAGVVGDAQQTAQAAVAAASATAAETLSVASVQQTTFTADVAAAEAGGRAFEFEYYLRNLKKGLQNANLTVIDDRLVTGNRATIDLRSYTAGDAAGAKRLY